MSYYVNSFEEHVALMTDEACALITEESRVSSVEWRGVVCCNIVEIRHMNDVSPSQAGRQYLRIRPSQQSCTHSSVYKVTAIGRTDYREY